MFRTANRCNEMIQQVVSLLQYGITLDAVVSIAQDKVVKADGRN